MTRGHDGRIAPLTQKQLDVISAKCADATSRLDALAHLAQQRASERTETP